MVAENPVYRRDFVTRQDLLRKQQELEFEKMVERVDQENNQCTFKPSIGNANEVLVHTRPARMGENKADVVERLANQVLCVIMCVGVCVLVFVLLSPPL